jgi:hypothetical protein
MTTPTMTAAPTGLRAARAEQAAARRAAKAPAKKAPAKAPAKKAAAKAAGTAKLRWTIHKEYDTPAGKDQSAAFGGGELAIERTGEGYRAVFKKGTSEKVLAETGSFGRAYTACTAHAKAAA